MIYNFDEIIDRRGTFSVKYDMCKAVFGRADVLPMWVADMDFRTPDFIRDAVIRDTLRPRSAWFQTHSFCLA